MPPKIHSNHVKSLPTPLRIPTREQGNPMFPLPADYHELSLEGQRLARLNVCCFQETPEDMVVAWDFFRRTYLFPTEPGFFYGDDLVESPPMHYEIVHSLGANPFNIRACPRGFGKSTLVDEIILLLGLSRPYFPTMLCLATDSLVEERFEIYHTQFTLNEYLIEDWGYLKPNKGEGKWNQHMMHLRNGSRLRGFGVEGRKRGTKPRPRLLFLDDPEYDPKGSTDTQKLREDFNNLLTRVLLNMGERGMCMGWWGTMISKQSSLWFWLMGEDPRARMWNRKLYQVWGEDGKPLWADYMDDDAIQEKMELLGSASFATEYLNNPGEGTAQTFQVDPKMHFYHVDDEEKVGSSPLSSTAQVSYMLLGKKGQTDEPVEKTVEFGAHVRDMFRCMMMDYAPSISPTSDFSALVVVGFERPFDVLWVLDCWQGKVKDETLIEKMYQMGVKWRPRVVGIESVSIQKRVYEMGKSLVESRASEQGWVPKVLPISYTRAQGSKQDRIAAMQWRFTTNRIRLPGGSMVAGTHWKQLFHQINEFRAESSDGNLQHDDLIDTLAMYQEIHRSSGRAKEDVPERRILRPLDMLSKNQTIDTETGLQPVMGINASDLSDELLSQQALMWAGVQEEQGLSKRLVQRFAHSPLLMDLERRE